jgi:hypothetical protein
MRRHSWPNPLTQDSLVCLRLYSKRQMTTTSSRARKPRMIARMRSLEARHLLNLTALAALAIVLFHATFTTNNARFARYSSALSDLCLAILAAWIFNLIVIELPRRRDRQSLYPNIAWMVALMANSGISLVEFLATTAHVDVKVDPKVGGVIVQADKALAHQICAAIGPETPYVPVRPDTCLQLIRAKVGEARGYHNRLQAWLSFFDVEVSAAMNAVILSQLATLLDMLDRLPVTGGTTLTFLADDLYDHWRASDELEAVYFKRVLPYVPSATKGMSRRQRKDWTPQRRNELAIANARQALASQNASSPQAGGDSVGEG